MVTQIDKELKNLNLPDLKVMAKQLGVKGYSKLRKAELVKVLKDLAKANEQQGGARQKKSANKRTRKSAGKKKSPKRSPKRPRKMKGGGTVGAPHSETFDEWRAMANVDPQTGGSPTGLPMRYFNESHSLRAPQVGGSPTGLPMRYFNETHALRAPDLVELPQNGQTGGASCHNKKNQKGGHYTRGGTLQEKREQLKEKMRRAKSPLKRR